MNEQYEKLKQVIQQANPEIMELKFGCRVNWQRPKEGFNRIFVNFADVENFGEKYSVIASTDNLSSQDERWGRVTVKTSDLESLGRPIRLADVLVAMQRLADNDPERHWVVNRWGEFLIERKGYPGMVVGVSWNPQNDNLDNQSEKLKEFLIIALVK